MNKKLALWLKAIGFLLFIVSMYLYANVVMSLIASIGLIFTGLSKAGSINYYLENPLDYYDAMMTTITGWLPLISVGVSVITLGMVAIVFMARKDKLMAYIGFKKIPIKDSMLLIVQGVSLYCIILPILVGVMEILPTSMVEHYESLMMPMSELSFVGLFITVSINAPLFEEIIVRGILFNDFKKAAPTFVAVIIQALIFGAMHMNLIQGSYAFVIGLIFGLTYLTYRSIWAPILLHFAFNTTSIVMGYIFVNSIALYGYLIMLTLGVTGFLTIRKILQQNYPLYS